MSTPPDPLLAVEVTVKCDGDRRPDTVVDDRLPNYVIVNWGSLGAAANSIIDPTTVSAKVPVSGEQYGFRLEELLPRLKSLKLSALQAPAPVSVNSQPAPAHRNTVAPTPLRLVKLDVGHWGAYHRDRESGTGPTPLERPQRDFGLVEGSVVLLCRFHTSGAVAAPASGVGATLPGPGAQALVKAVEARGCGVEIISVARANAAPMKQGDALHLYLPDLHLPERWPDRPAVPPDKLADPAFAQLQDVLLQAQREPSSIVVTLSPGGYVANTLSQGDQDDIQAHLEAIDAYQKGPAGEPEPQFTIATPVFPPSATVFPGVPSYAPTSFGVADFLAAKALVDRKIILESCWFYSAGTGGDGDATPAVDLVNFLSAVQAIDPAVKVKVFQVGDLHELWLNHEFLYRDFPLANPKAGDSTALTITKLVAGDLPQYRMDEGWIDDAGVAHPVKRYVFHRWKDEHLLFRNRVGSDSQLGAHKALFPDPSSATPLRSLKAGDAKVRARIARAGRLLRARVDAVKAFALPSPATAAAKLIPDADLAPYATTNAAGATEYLWNKLILDKLAALRSVNIYGNHDGYRGDPLLKGYLEASDQALPYVSLPGIWLEHSHRWDDFNRDGMAFGAGVTNMVYYRRPRLLRADKMKDEVRFPWVNEPQEQEAFIPGAALWMLLRLADGLAHRPAKLSDVKDFGVYVGGHTHTAELVTIKFDLTVGGSLTAKKEEVQAVVKQAQDLAKDVDDLLHMFDKK